MDSIKLTKRFTAILIAFVIVATAFAVPSTANASSFYDVTIVAPENNSVCFLGDPISIRVNPSIYVNGTGNYIQIRVVKSGTVVFSKNIAFGSDLRTVATSYTPKKAGAYTVKACYSPLDQDKLYDDTPSVVSFTVKDMTKEIKDMKPTIKAYRYSRGMTQVSWKAKEGLKLKIYRATKKTGTYKLIKTSSKDLYNDEGVSGDKTYYYKARWVYRKDGKNYFSPYSAIKTANTNGIPQIKSLKYVAGKGVKITWTESTFADEYFVFRTNDDGFFKTVKKGKTYIYDKSVKKGKKYTYEVKAFNEKAQNGKASDEKSIKIPS